MRSDDPGAVNYRADSGGSAISELNWGWVAFKVHAWTKAAAEQKACLGLARLGTARLSTIVPHVPNNSKVLWRSTARLVSVRYSILV